MSTDRKRTRRGRHASVAGDPAEETLSDLVGQFTDRYAFVRELIQNSLDAGAGRVDIDMAFDAGALRVAIRDDGEGMDRATIEGYLLTLFRSTKEEDLTKIGKFGIGFVSLFAMAPRQVTVDTGRDGIWHRVVFAEDRSYTLLVLDDPYEGTTVTLELPRSKKKAQADCERIRDAAHTWCRFAEADIYTSARGVRKGWPTTGVEGPFSVDAPIQVEEVADGFHAVLGPSRTAAVGFYNHGLTLYEAEEAMIPGVTFRVKARHLEHTLTRDNVRREKRFQAVIERIQNLARTRLADAVHAAVEAAASAMDLDEVRRLFAALGPELPWTWRADAGLIPAVGRPPLTPGDLGTGGWLRSRPDTWWGPPADPLAEAVAATGARVVAADTADDAHLSWLTLRLGAAPRPVADAWRMVVPHPVQPPHVAAATALADRALGWRVRITVGTVYGAAADKAGFVTSGPGTAEAAREREPWPADHVALNAAHRTVAAVLALDPRLAAPLVVRTAQVAIGRDAPLSDDLVAAAREAWR